MRPVRLGGSRLARRIRVLEIGGGGNHRAALDVDQVASAAARFADRAGAEAREVDAIAGRKGHTGLCGRALRADPGMPFA
jgi:hypothetical protein